MTDQPQQTPLQPPLTEDKTEVLEHIVELRQRLIACVLALVAVTCVCYFYNDLIFSWLIAPLAESMGQEGTRRLIYTSLTEAFTTTLKLSFLTALFITMPLILSQLWMFLAPGLYKTERRAFLPFFVATPVLFILGGLLVYFYVMPLAWQFFLGFQTTATETVLPIQLEARIADYLNLIISLVFAFGLCFQLPVLLMLLARAGIVSADTLASKRKYMLIAAFLVGAVLTPPDVLSQTLLALPLYLLYELSIFLICRIENAKAEAARDDFL
jgi:sec-independent protein translocase protein TatC